MCPHKVYDMRFPGGSDCKEPAHIAGDLGSIPEVGDLGSIPEEWNGYPRQYPCLDNSMERGAWKAIVHEVPKSQT